MVDERKAYHRLQRLFPRAHWQRIESWTGTGIFDANGCLQGVEAWIECKEATRPKTARGKVKPKVRPAQVAWEYLRREAGGRTFVALLVEDRLFIIRGEHIGQIKKGVPYTWLLENDVNPRSIFQP